MSWARILRFAKQRQVPVVITDESGEDPMILLSLDALEQALDGGVGPDLPPPTPAPRSTTPSFVPEQFEVPVYKETPFVAAEEFVAEPESGELASAVESEVILEEVPVPELIPEPKLELISPIEPDELVPATPLVINDFETPEPTKPVLVVGDDRHSEVEIMTPPMPAPLPIEAAPTTEIKADEAKSGLADAIKTTDPAKPKDISLEERFFLDF